MKISYNLQDLVNPLLKVSDRFDIALLITVPTP
jgi:hypothetical protein